MRAALCDDDKKHNTYLAKLLNNYMRRSEIDNFEITDYTSGRALLEKYILDEFDFIFLDVDMPSMDGFETAKRIRDMDLDVSLIFVTRLADQMPIGYNYGAKQYLCKPITQEEIDTLMDRLLSELRRMKSKETYSVKLKSRRGGTAYLQLSKVLYFESQNKHVLAHIRNQKEPLIFRGTLPDVDNDLKDKSFVRIHQSYLINRDHVFNEFGDNVVMGNGCVLPISKKYRSELIELIKGVW